MDYLQKAKSQTFASLPVKSLVVPAQFLDCLAGLESVEAMCQRVECRVQDQRQEDEMEAVEEEQRAVDWVTDGYLLSHPD